MKDPIPSSELLEDVLKLREQAASYWNAWCLQAAVKIDLFTLLDRQPLSPQQVASELNLDPTLINSLMEVLAMDKILLRAGDDKFANGEAASAALVKGSPLDQTGSILHNQAAQTMGPVFPEIFKPDFELPKTSAAKESPANIFAAAKSAARLKAPIILPFLDLGENEKIVDIGAGSGDYTFLMASNHADLQGTLIDRGAMAEGSKLLADEMGLGDRIEVIDEDFLKANPGTDYTLALVSHIVHFISFEDSRKLLKRVFEWMAPGGRIAIHDLLRERSTEPVIEAELLNLDVFIRHGIAVPTCADVMEWLSDAGFVEPREVAMPIGPNTLIFARKP